MSTRFAAITATVLLLILGFQVSAASAGTDGWATGNGPATDKDCQEWAEVLDGWRDETRFSWQHGDALGAVEASLGVDETRNDARKAGCILVTIGEEGPLIDGPSGGGGDTGGDEDAGSTCEDDDETSEGDDSEREVAAACEDDTGWGDNGGRGWDTTPGSCNTTGRGNCAEGGPNPDL